MGLLTTETPVTRTMAMDFAGSRRVMRRYLVYQVAHSQSVAIKAKGDVIAIAMLCTKRRHQLELSIAFKPEAGRYLLALIRLLRLTLPGSVNNGAMVWAKISVSNHRARLMAELAGFRQSGLVKDRSIWIYDPKR